MAARRFQWSRFPHARSERSIGRFALGRVPRGDGPIFHSWSDATWHRAQDRRRISTPDTKARAVRPARRRGEIRAGRDQRLGPPHCWDCGLPARYTRVLEPSGAVENWKGPSPAGGIHRQRPQLENGDRTAFVRDAGDHTEWFRLRLGVERQREGFSVRAGAVDCQSLHGDAAGRRHLPDRRIASGRGRIRWWDRGSAASSRSAGVWRCMDPGRRCGAESAWPAITRAPGLSGDPPVRTTSSTTSRRIRQGHGSDGCLGRVSLHQALRRGRDAVVLDHLTVSPTAGQLVPPL
jgi:hypothetical protein